MTLCFDWGDVRCQRRTDMREGPYGRKECKVCDAGG